MEFDTKRVYTAVNADKLKVGSKVICADDLRTLKELVEKAKSEDDEDWIEKLEKVRGENSEFRFTTFHSDYNLAYLISEPEEKKLKWTDLKIGDVIKQKEGTYTTMVVSIDTREENGTGKSISHILAGDTWLDDDDLEYWEKVE